MKQTFYLFTFILIGCSSNVKDKSEATNSLEQHDKAMKSFQQYTIRDTIAVDLDGDSIQDLAYFKTNINRKSIVVRDGKTKKEITIGLDKSFKDIGSNFNWVDNWGTTNDTEVYENVISNGEIIGGKKVKLTNKSLFVGKDDAGGGIITFKAGRLLWIHQADWLTAKTVLQNLLEIPSTTFRFSSNFNQATKLHQAADFIGNLWCISGSMLKHK